jgi:organic radical activating enzyme
MSVEEIKELLHFSAISKYSFDFILTGGDPLLWNNLEEGLVALRKSPVTKSITMFTNAMFHKRLTQKSVDCLDAIRISHYDGNESHMDEMKKTWPDKVHIVDRTEFWENPSEPVEGSLPAQCLNPETLYYNRRVYACPHSASIAKKNGSEVQTFFDLKSNFLNDYRAIRIGQEKDICSMCISNMKVRNQVEKIVNITR